MSHTTVKRPRFDPLKRIRTGKTFPPATWRPYPRASIYKPIPGTSDGSAGSPSIHTDSAAMVTKLTGWGNPSQILIAQDSSSAQTFPSFNHPTYFATEADPVFEIRMRTGGNTNSDWTTTSGPSVHCPQDAMPAGGTDVNTDGHFAVIQPDGTEWFVYDVWSNLAGTTRLTELPSGGGIIYGTGLSRHHINGDGRRIGNGSATAACVASMFGPYRVDEVRARKINHALFMVIRSTDGTFVAPADKDAGSTDPTDAPPNGARFQLNMTQTQIDAIADSGNSSGRWWNKVLLTAMREYGMYVLDTSGASWTVQPWSGESQRSLTGTDPWRTWAASTSPAMSYNATDDIYLWDIRTVVTWSSVLRVLDWTDPLNH